MSNEAKTINKKKAQDKELEYTSPIILHDTTRTRITCMPYYIPRSSGSNDIALQIKRFNKSKVQGLTGPQIQLDEDVTINLQDSAVRLLAVTLTDYLQIANHDAGNYLVLRMNEGVTDISNQDPALVSKVIANILSDKEVIEYFQNQELSEEIIAALKGHIKIKELKNALEKLRSMLDTGDSKESSYQSWCEEHSWVFGNAYAVNDKIRNISAGDSLDIIIPIVTSGYRDLIELKRPDKNILQFDESHHNYYFSSDVSKAIGQTHRYLDVFAEEAATGLKGKPEIIAYHPRAVIVIGRSNDWVPDQFKALHGLNRRLNGITVMTYDHLLTQGERLLQVVEHQNEN